MFPNKRKIDEPDNLLPAKLPKTTNKLVDRRPLKLPTEIFDHVLSFTSTGQRWRIRGVSQAWRDSIEGNKLLWRRLDFTEFRMSMSLSAAQKLQRLAAGGCRQLSFNVHPGTPGFMDWQTSQLGHDVSMILALYPNLEALSLPAITISLELATMVSRVSRLKTLTLELGPPVVPTDHNNTNHWRTAKTDLREILPLFANLEELTLQNIITQDDMSAFRQYKAWAEHWMWPVANSLASLKSVCIKHDFCEAAELDVANMLKSLSAAAPNLEALHLHRPSVTTLPAFPKLKELVLKDVHQHHLPRSMPQGIEKLSIDCHTSVDGDEMICDGYRDALARLPYLSQLRELNTNLEISAWECPDRVIVSEQDIVRHLHLWSDVLAKSQCQLEVLRIRQPESMMLMSEPTDKVSDFWLGVCLVKHPHLFANLRTLEVEVHPSRQATCDDELGLALAKACPRLSFLSWNGRGTLSESTIAALRANPKKTIQIIHISDGTSRYL